MIRFIRTILPSGVLLLLLFVLAACGSTSTTSSSGNSTTAPTATADTSTTPTSPPTGKYSATPTSSSTNAAALKTAMATVNGKAETLLTNARAMTLYYFTPDTKTTATCTGGCVGTWPPLLTTGSSVPTSATTLPGKLTVLTNANGTQVQYNGHFLYTYAGDSAPGQTNGEGVGGKWFVATTTLAS